MGFYILLILAVLIFGTLLFVWQKWKKNALYVLAIGGAVGANIYNIGSFPILDGNFIFGIDSVIYTLFIVCVVIMLFDYGIKSARTLLYVTITSIGFTAIIQFFALWGAGSLNTDALWGLVSFAFSMLATWVACEGMFWIFKHCSKNHYNKHIIFIFCVLFGTIVNSLVYFGGMAIVGQLGDNFGWGLLSSYIGKFLSLAMGYVVWIVGNFIHKKKEEKEIIIEKQIT